ncbi:hypothetical protein D915_004382 [Fasciola hepatica]|uniref:Uncharacterized protein n=1 Tax=Fasciola hepatica TaxID=6192 RepID=A0A4E0S1R2_FASHE|nr:hypothetical protein D915_004382 [Fasciola hepatica]
MILYCQLQFPIDKHPWATVHTIGHVILHSKRNLGPMISQIITYQNEDKRFFAVGPKWSSILSTRDLTDQWTGISLPGYRNCIDGKNHTNTTYLLWEETRTFNKNLYGAKCAEFTADDWNCK